MGWVVNNKPRPLYLQDRPGTHCLGDWVGSRGGLHGCRKSKINKHRITILPAASCGHETWSLIVRGETMLRAFGNRVQRIIFGPW